jgi:hypothetical protein
LLVALLPGGALGEPPAIYEQVGEVEGLVPRGRFFDREANLLLTKSRPVVRVYDVRTLTPIGEPCRFGRSFDDLHLSGDGKSILVTRFDSDAVELWDVATRKLRSMTRCPNGEVDTADVSPDGGKVVIASLGPESTVTLHAAGERTPQVRLIHKPNPGQSVWFDPTGAFIVAHFIADAYHVFSADDGRGLLTVDTEDDYLQTSSPNPPQFNPKGGQVLFQQRKGFTLVDSGTWGRLIKVTLPDPDLIGDVLFSTDGTHVSLVVERSQPRRYEQQVYNADNGSSCAPSSPSRG